jgi:hypothetical protein
MGVDKSKYPVSLRIKIECIIINKKGEGGKKPGVQYNQTLTTEGTDWS